MAATTRRAFVVLLAIALGALCALGALGATAATAAPPGADMTGNGNAAERRRLRVQGRARGGDVQPGKRAHELRLRGGPGPFCVNPWPEGKDNGGATVPGRDRHHGEDPWSGS